MKKINFRIVVTSILVLALGCTFGAAGVSALTADGESLLSGLVSVGTSLGIDIDGFISTTAATTTTAYIGNAQADLAAFLAELGFDYSYESVIEATDYILNRQGTFEDWIHSKYGDNVNVPTSVKMMTTTDIVLFLMGNMLNPGATTTVTTTKYIYSTKEHEETTVTVTESTTADTTTKPVTVTEITEIYLNGDVDNDGKVSASDARLTLRAGAGLEKLDALAAEAADVNGDGRITAKDARSILRYAAKLSDGF